MSDLTEFIKEQIDGGFTIIAAAIMVALGTIVYVLLIAPK
jgi:hypothetical protein